MSHHLLQQFVGTWSGTVRTWFDPGKLADESSVTGTITLALGGPFVRHVYEGTIQGRPRHGEELLAFEAISHTFQVAWIDDFHTQKAMLYSEGKATEHGFSVLGSYEVGPDHPPWGWRTTYELDDAGQLVITAYNITPEGEEAIGIETRYERVSPE